MGVHGSLSEKEETSGVLRDGLVNLSCRLQERFLHVDRRFCRRFAEDQTIRRRESFALLTGDRPAGQVTLVALNLQFRKPIPHVKISNVTNKLPIKNNAYENDDGPVIGELLHILQPALDVIECFAPHQSNPNVN